MSWDPTGPRVAPIPSGNLSKHSADTWEIGFACLQRFVAREGNALVPSLHEEEDYKLGPWVSSQRARYKNGRITPEQEAKLESFYGWIWSQLDVQWELSYETLLVFQRREGHIQVPFRHIEDGINLGHWVRFQK